MEYFYKNDQYFETKKVLIKLKIQFPNSCIQIAIPKFKVRRPVL